MKEVLTVGVTIFDILWLCAALLLLWNIWRSSSAHTRRLMQLLIEVSMKSADAAQRSADAAYLLAKQPQEQEKGKQPPS